MHARNFLVSCKTLAFGPTSLAATFKTLSTLPQIPIVPNRISHKQQQYHHLSAPEDPINRFFAVLLSIHNPSQLRQGRQVHAQIVVNGIDESSLLVRLLGMYVISQSFSDAKVMFFALKEKSTSMPWNWMIRGFTMMGWSELALLFYFKMWFSGALPDKYTFTFVLKSCCNLAAIGLGRLIHKTIQAMEMETDLYVGSSLIKMYAEYGDIEHARKVFDQMSQKDCVLWNVMIDGYARTRDVENAVGMFREMIRAGDLPNSVSFACVLSVCAVHGMLNYGTQFHGLACKVALELESSVGNTLLAMYSKSRCMLDVQKLFDLMPQTDLVAWNGMISGYVQNSMKEEAIRVFYMMQSAGVKPDSITFSSFLPAFSDPTSLKQKEIHSYIIRNDVFMDAFLKSALIDLYFKSKDSRSAQNVFYSNGEMDIVICSAMISGYVLNGMSANALDMFRHLLKARLKPNPVTISSVLPACSSLVALRLGKELHGQILKNAFEDRCYVSSALMDMYTKCGRLDVGYIIFSSMSVKDPVAWNSMISSFTQNGQPEEAMSLFRQMRQHGMEYDSVSVSSSLSACASLPSLHHGKEIHGFVIRGALPKDLFVESALIDMYAKCGNLDLARRVFDLMADKNEVTWNSIIAAYGTHGLVKDAMTLFRQMKEVGFLPDHLTFLALISACGHAGQVEQGFQLFQSMHKKHGIAPRMEHYASMVDLFGRAGQLVKALEFIKGMPFKPDAGIWGAVLGACRVYGNVEIAEIASTQLFELDPENSGYYVIFSNINAVAGKWDGVLRARKLMRGRKIQKVPGCSWIVINNKSHMFVASDKEHLDSAYIYFLLKGLLLVLIEEGYVPKPDIFYPLPMETPKAGANCLIPLAS